MRATASGGYGLDPVRSPIFGLCMRSAYDRARSLRARSAQCIPTGIPLLVPFDHDVENADQLAHAGDQRHFLWFALGNQAVVKGLQDWIVLCRRPEAGHIEYLARPAASALDVPLASTPATVVIVR